MHNINFKRIAVIMFAVLMVMCMTAGISVSAAESKSLTLICRSEKVTLTGMKWRIYRVGSRQGNDFILEGDFADYPVSFDDLSVATITQAAETLENYAVLDKLAVLNEGETDETGELSFDKLESGIYLVCGENLQIDKTVYVPSAILIEVADGDVDLNAYPKFAYRTISDETKKYNVKKIWMNDEDHPEDRAVSIKVEIYRDDVMFETVLLSESNDWSYSWDDDENSQWRVIETEVPDKYTVTYRSNETQLAIVNTYQESVPDVTTVTSNNTSEQQTETTIKASNSENSTVKSSSSSSTSKLPQTGQLWWPVPVMALGGVILAGIGLRLQLRHKKDDD